MINNQYDLLFTYKALVNSYPKAYEALAYTISFFSFIGLFLILIPNKNHYMVMQNLHQPQKLRN